MKNRIAIALAALVITGATFTIALAAGSDTTDDGATPVPAADVNDVGASDDGSISKGVPAPGFEDSVDETVVEDGAGMAVPGFEGDVDETVVEIGTGMAVPGFEGDVTDTVVEETN